MIPLKKDVAKGRVNLHRLFERQETDRRRFDILAKEWILIQTSLRQEIGIGHLLVHTRNIVSILIHPQHHCFIIVPTAPAYRYPCLGMRSRRYARLTDTFLIHTERRNDR
ncbi:rh142.2 [macacine betaherpesvirus 3]|uniref:Rh142.2 n=1 Tax=Rhesus cytomegalovirus (strain 68-1) TaxID=47929 RepID=Q2FAG6_RHCM6|nr:rh142.2 [macacine betaherpesvirus 3]